MKTRSTTPVVLPALLGLLVSVGALLFGCAPTHSVSSSPSGSKVDAATSSERPDSSPAEKSDSYVSANDDNKVSSKAPAHPSVSPIFLPPVRIMAGEEFVSVEAPGYACPTMADVDGDGQPDLVVGQFKNGNLQFCKNIAGQGELPRFATAQWLTTGDQRAMVPGVW